MNNYELKIVKLPDRKCYQLCVYDKEKHTYSVIDIHNGANYKHELSMPEHKLLHELFVCWGWLENDK